MVYQKLELLKTELEVKIDKEVLKLQNDIQKLDKKFTIMFIILAFLIIFINKDAVNDNQTFTICKIVVSL